MVENQIDSVNDLKDHYQKQKKEFVIKANREKTQELSDQRQTLEMKALKERSAHDYQMDVVKSDARRAEDRLNRKIGVMEKKAQKEIELMTLQNLDKATEDRIDFKNTLFEQQQEASQRLVKVKVDADRKMNRQRLSSEAAIEEMAIKHRDEIASVKREYEKEIKRRNANSDARFRRLAQQFEIQRQSMVNQYEDRMEKMRLAQDQAIQTKNREINRLKAQNS